MKTMVLQLKICCLYISLMLSLYRCSVIRAQNFKRGKQGVSFAMFIKVSSVKLDTVRLANLKVSKLGECTFECLNHEECLSANLGRTSIDGKYSCELLRMDEFGSDELVASNDFDHYHIKTPCMSSPCQNGAKCIPSYANNDYFCKCEDGFTGEHCEKVNWIKMKPHTENSPICFGSLGDNPGMFTTPSSGDVITFKLVHVYGKVSCHLGCLSNWGCRSRSEPEKMGTYIADSNKTRLLPNNAELFGTESFCSSRIYYSLPGHTVDSPELLFDNFTTPLHVTAGQQFAVWFAEDFSKCYDTDNDWEETCVDAYGLLV